MAEKQMWNATGRRKRSIAQISLKLGKGNIIVNGTEAKKYFPFETLYMDLVQPFELTETLDKFDTEITVRGGGFNGQTGAMRLGITRALLNFNPEFRKVLKDNGMVSRDSRIKERKKYGLKKARRAPQFSKR